MTQQRSCPICGGSHFTNQEVLWQELIQKWELAPHEVDYINRQQGRTCDSCGVNWRSLALASAIMAEFGFEGLFHDFVTSPAIRNVKTLEINGAGMLSPWLAAFPLHTRVDYPSVDMQKMPFADGSFDLVIHSDTLEHVPDPLAGLSECRRILSKHGRCIFTIPIIVGRLTRASNTEHPSFHGNPSNPPDYQVRTEFGADAWCSPVRAGFEACKMHAWEFPSAVTIVAHSSNASDSRSNTGSDQIAPQALDLERGSPKTPSPSPFNSPSIETVKNSPSPKFTGERLLPSLDGAIVEEHLHRYATAVAWSQHKDILDLACGDGYGANLLAANARSVIGIDIDPETIHHAQKRYQHPNLRFLTADCRELPLDDASFDLIVSFETIEHIHDQEKFIREMRRVLRPDGVLLISTPDPAVYRVGQPPNPFHVKELSRQDFLQLLRTSFQTVSLADQRIWNGSLIVPESSHDRSGNFQSMTGDFHQIQFTPGLIRPMYVIAAATNRSTLPEWVWGAFTTQEKNASTLLDEVQRRKVELEAIRQSLSWRLTAPLRWLGEKLGAHPSQG
ncbi:methyltransferase domain-containing protein [Lacunimicrobium album]